MKLRRYLIMPPVAETYIGFGNGIEYGSGWVLIQKSPSNISAVAAAIAIAPHDYLPIDVIGITHILNPTSHLNHPLQCPTTRIFSIEQHGFLEIVTIPIQRIIGRVGAGIELFGVGGNVPCGALILFCLAQSSSTSCSFG